MGDSETDFAFSSSYFNVLVLLSRGEMQTLPGCGTCCAWEVGAAQGPTLGPARIKAHKFLQVPSQSTLTEIFYGVKDLLGEGIL